MSAPASPPHPPRAMDQQTASAQPSPVSRVLARVERTLRGSGITRIPGVGPLVELGRTRAERILADRVPVRVAEFALFMPRRFFPNYGSAGTYEPLTQQSFRDVLRPGMTMVDVGAHIGFYTILSARLVGPGGRVHAFEPARENLEYLERNLAHHGLGQVTVHAAAVGRESCLREFHLTRSSDSNGFYAHPLAETVETLQVQQRALDDVVSGPVHALKIDVEGAETEVLDGMTRILRENPRLTLWMEWNPSCMRNAGYDPLDLPRRLRELGFRLSVLDDVEQRRPPLEETLARVAGGGTPEEWFVNLLCERE